MSPDDFGATFMPYCLERQPDGRYHVLNRARVPLSVEPVELKGLTAKVAAAASCKGDPGLALIYLYDDTNVPTASVTAMKAYQGRVSRLMKLKVLS